MSSEKTIQVTAPAAPAWRSIGSLAAEIVKKASGK